MMYCLNFNSPLKKQERDWNTISVSVIVTRDVTMDMSVSQPSLRKLTRPSSLLLSVVAVCALEAVLPI